jgi:predicted nucleic acid-binding protein
MVLVDTSIWIDHFRSGSQQLVDLLNDTQVLVHPMIVGELACGNLRNRDEILNHLTRLPHVNAATDTEVLFFIEQQKLMGKGIGYVDANLLASVSISQPAKIWTRDKRLDEMAEILNLNWRPYLS